MIRGKWKWDRERQELVSCEEEQKVQAPAIVDDTLLEPLTFHGDNEGRKFDSYSKYQAYLKEKGFAIKEKGMFPEQWAPPKADPKEIREEVEKLYQDIKYDRVPISEEQREQCKREKREQEAFKKRNWHLS